MGAWWGARAYDLVHRARAMLRVSMIGCGAQPVIQPASHRERNIACSTSHSLVAPHVLQLTGLSIICCVCHHWIVFDAWPALL